MLGQHWNDIIFMLEQNQPHFNQLRELLSSGGKNALYLQLLESFRQSLKESEQHYGSLIANIPDIVFSLSQDGAVLTINQAVTALGYRPEQLIGRAFDEFIYFEDRQRVAGDYRTIIAAGKDCTRIHRFRIQCRSGELRWLEANSTIRFDPAGRFLLQEGVCRDITESIEQEQSLIKTQEELEEKVRIRTAELMRANDELRREIAQHNTTERNLRDREAELRLEKENLQEANTALKVLLKRRKLDKQELQEQVMINMRELVLPYIEKLKKGDLNDRQQACIEIIGTNLNEITNAFGRKLSLKFYGLTASELKVADLIRQGRKTREISILLGISCRTVEAYRQAIRRKLSIRNEKVNLRTFLMSLDNLSPLAS